MGTSIGNALGKSGKDLTDEQKRNRALIGAAGAAGNGLSQMQANNPTQPVNFSVAPNAPYQPPPPMPFFGRY